MVRASSLPVQQYSNDNEIWPARRGGSPQPVLRFARDEEAARSERPQARRKCRSEVGKFVPGTVTERPRGMNPVVGRIRIVRLRLHPRSQLSPGSGAGWHDAAMGRDRSREPRRGATRKRPSMLLVSSDPPSAEGSEQASGGLAGDIEAPDELIGAATASVLAAIAAARSPLAAELVVCAAFGAVETGLPDDADEQERSESLALMLDQVIGHGEMIASVEALALLRVCSVLGPAPSRSAARESAGRLATAGVADRPWAARVGRPQMLRAWRYGDVFGAQTSVGVLFDYQGREHVVMVLVDHLLGGGVKDCWVSEGRAAKDMRNSVAAAMAGDPETFFEDIDAAAVAALLGSALACPPCPMQADQIEDVNTHLYLLRARVEHLARLAAT